MKVTRGVEIAVYASLLTILAAVTVVYLPTIAMLVASIVFFVGYARLADWLNDEGQNHWAGKAILCFLQTNGSFAVGF